MAEQKVGWPINGVLWEENPYRSVVPVPKRCLLVRRRCVGSAPSRLEEYDD
jgi:hypothetical protein